MKIKRIISTLLVLLLVISAISCGTDLSSTEEEMRTVMTVDGYEVPYEMYRYAALMHLRDLSSEFVSGAEGTGRVTDGTVGVTDELDTALFGLSADEMDALAAEVEKYSIETIVNIYSLFTAAEKEGIDPFGEMMDSLTDMKMEEIRATYENDEEYLETIKLFYMNDSVYNILTRYEIVFDNLYELYVKNDVIDVSDEAVIEHMSSDDSARAKQILISFERHSEEEAYSLALEVAQKVSMFTSEEGIVDEEQFDALTDKVGEDLFMFKNRDGYYISKGYSDKAFEDAVFALEIGHVSDVVRTSAGYSVIMRAEPDREYIKDNVSSLKEISVGGIYRSILDEYSANAKVEKTEEFEKLDIYTMR